MATATQKQPDGREEKRGLSVAKAAAQAAVAASKNTGRDVDPRVKELAES
jgi:hypothetical protein